eukprot:171869-Pyramimonas_sp.AAC.1
MRESGAESLGGLMDQVFARLSPYPGFPRSGSPSGRREWRHLDQSGRFVGVCRFAARGRTA